MQTSNSLRSKFKQKQINNRPSENHPEIRPFSKRCSRCGNQPSVMSQSASMPQHHFLRGDSGLNFLVYPNLVVSHLCITTNPHHKPRPLPGLDTRPLCRHSHCDVVPTGGHRRGGGGSTALRPQPEKKKHFGASDSDEMKVDQSGICIINTAFWPLPQMRRPAQLQNTVFTAEPR